jgi:hypothetical protein
MTKTTTITRKSVPKGDESIRLKIVQSYTNGHPIEEISNDTGWSEASIRREINQFFRSFKDVLETESLLLSQKVDASSTSAKTKASIALYRNQKKIDKNINTKFLDKLSSDNDTVLTEEERLFCYLLVHEGDEVKALQDSGLAEGLAKSGTGYKRAMKLRCLMLKGKRNLIKYMNDLQINYAKDLNISKGMIQTELIQQLRQLKEQNNPRNAPTIAKLTEQLGRTVGAFTEKIVIEEVSFDDSMNHMLEMRKKREDKALASANTDSEASTFVYDPEAIG